MREFDIFILFSRKNHPNAHVCFKVYYTHRRCTKKNSIHSLKFNVKFSNCNTGERKVWHVFQTEIFSLSESKYVVLNFDCRWRHWSLCLVWNIKILIFWPVLMFWPINDDSHHFKINIYMRRNKYYDMLRYLNSKIAFIHLSIAWWNFLSRQAFLYRIKSSQTLFYFTLNLEICQGRLGHHVYIASETLVIALHIAL